MFGSATLLLLLALWAPLTTATVFEGAQDMVNWMGGVVRPSYGLFVGSPERARGLPSGLVWIFVSRSASVPDAHRVDLDVDEFLEEIQGLDLFSRGFLEIHVSSEAVSRGAFTDNGPARLISLMMLLRLSKVSTVRFPLPINEYQPLNLLEQYFYAVNLMEGRPYPFELGGQRTAYLECVGRKWQRKDEFITLFVQASVPPSSWFYSSCSVM
jgi:hypothetical protein